MVLRNDFKGFIYRLIWHFLEVVFLYVFSAAEKSSESFQKKKWSSEMNDDDISAFLLCCVLVSENKSIYDETKSIELQKLISPNIKLLKDES